PAGGAWTRCRRQPDRFGPHLDCRRRTAAPARWRSRRVAPPTAGGFALGRQLPQRLPGGGRGPAVRLYRPRPAGRRQPGRRLRAAGEQTSPEAAWAPAERQWWGAVG